MDETQQASDKPKPSHSDAAWHRWKDILSNVGIGVGLLLLITSGHVGNSAAVAAWGVGIYAAGLIIYFGGTIVGILPWPGRGQSPEG